jgi:hypothetical protein
MSDIKKKVDSEWKKKAEDDKAKLEEVKEQAEEQLAADEGPLPPPTFAHFLAGLDLEARLALGEMKHPVTKEQRQDLVAAQYVIDTLALLKEKTKGNLETDEDILMQNLLTDLRFRFVQAKQRATGGAK